MERGFKSKAEKIAVEMRQLVGVEDDSPLPARALARTLDVPVLRPREIPGLPEKVAHQLEFNFEKNWSGITIPVGNKSIIIYNPSHIPARQESDIMHELAHLLCKHKPAQILSGNLPWKCRTFDKEQEDQATWLGGCLQLPRRALLASILRRLDNDAIAKLFGASPEMVRFRRNMTGVDKILRQQLLAVVTPVLEQVLVGNKPSKAVSEGTMGDLLQAELFQ